MRISKEYLVDLIRPHVPFVRGGKPIENCHYNQLYAIQFTIPSRLRKKAVTQAPKKKSFPEQISMFDQFDF